MNWSYESNFGSKMTATNVGEFFIISLNYIFCFVVYWTSAMISNATGDQNGEKQVNIAAFRNRFLSWCRMIG